MTTRTAVVGEIATLMKLSVLFSRRARSVWLDWRKPATRDGALLFALTAFLFGLAHVFDLPPHLLQFGLDHADWEVDDLIFVVFMMNVALMVFAFRRYKDGAAEIKARGRAEGEARKLARHDPLTGLPNRRFFEETLEECLNSASTLHQVAIMLLDLDGFKTVNDSYGHAAGDRALREFSKRISVILRAEGFLAKVAGDIRADVFFARVGGDEFTIILAGIMAPDEPANLARRIVTAVAEPFEVDDATTGFGVGIGIAIAPNDGVLADELVRRADRALYRAKAAGRSCIRFFEPEMDTHVDEGIKIERDFRVAVASKSITPHYQALVSLDGNRIIGFEALARWQNGDLGFVPPDVFIPIAEETGLISVLGDQLFLQACLDANTWPATFILAFNISPVQLRDPTLGLRLLSILGQTGFSPHRLEIEITENALIENVGFAKIIVDDLRRAGVRIALDDFGTGYATLSQLLSFRLDKIKIDRSFVSLLGDSRDGQVIVRAILALASGLGLVTTAEGVEDGEQLAYLKANGCTQGQGYLFSKAVPAEDVRALINRTADLSAVV